MCKYTTLFINCKGFGRTNSPMPGAWKGESPNSPRSQTKILISLMDALGIDKAYLIGNSAGGKGFYC